MNLKIEVTRDKRQIRGQGQRKKKNRGEVDADGSYRGAFRGILEGTVREGREGIHGGAQNRQKEIKGATDSTTFKRENMMIVPV